MIFIFNIPIISFSYLSFFCHNFVVQTVIIKTYETGVSSPFRAHIKI